MVKKITCLSLILLACNNLTKAQNPGGVSAGLKFWSKANTTNPTKLVQNPAVSSWGDENSTFALTQATTSKMPVYNAVGGTNGNFNFNPYIAFSKAGQTVLYNTATTPDMMGSAGTIFLVTNTYDPTNGSGSALTYKSVNNRYQIKPTFRIQHAFNTTTGYTTDFSGTVNYPTNAGSILVGLSTGSTATARRNATSFGVNNTSSTFIPSISDGFFVGGNGASGSESVDMCVAEIITYNTTLTAADVNKVESYLAVKYGITLNQATSTNYTSSNGTVIWSAAANAPFNQNITGIGADAASGLSQRQSRSVNTASLVYMFNGSYTGNSFPVKNFDNGNAMADQSFVLFGDNGGATALNRCYNSINSNYLRMNRIWKAQSTGSVSTVTIAAKVAEMPGGVGSILVSTDTSFAPGNTAIYKMTNANGYVARSLVLPANAYFTFATDSLVLQPTVNAPLCQGSTVQLSSNMGSGTFTWTGPNGYTSTQANPSIANCSPAQSGVYTVSGNINGCAVVPASVNVTINYVPAPPMVTTPVVYCTNAQPSPVTAIGQNLLWYYGATGGVGTTSPQLPNTTYVDTISYWVTQTVNGCESIRSLLNVQVYTKPNAVILASRPTICQYDTVQLFYFGNADTSANYSWKFPSGTTLQSGSGQGPMTVKGDTSGTVQIRLQLSNHGCVSDPAFYDLKIVPAPIVRSSFKKDACVDETVNVTLNYATPGIDRYTWDFNGGKIKFGDSSSGPYGVSWKTSGKKLVKVIGTAATCDSKPYIDTIDVHPLPVADITSPITDGDICASDSVRFQARLNTALDSVYRYEWGPKMFFEGNSYLGDTSWAKIPTYGFVTLKVTGPWGCVANDSVLIKAKNCCQMFFPSAFTPNGDNLNDYFRPITPGHHQIATFRVVNRWGNVVYESTDEDRGWDGFMAGVEQPVGVYYYYIKYKCQDQNFYEIKGEVSLIR